MFLACPACDTQYKLDDLALGPHGRKVRCVDCGHVWRALPPTPSVAEPMRDKTMRDEDMSISFSDDVSLSSAQDGAFDMALQDPALQDAPSRPPIPEALVTPTASSATYQPLGMSANVLGICVFALPLLLMIGILLAFQVPLLRALPGLSPVYAAVGIDVAVPLHALRLSELTVERKTVEGAGLLNLSAQLANTSPVAQAYPGLRVTVYDARGAELKTWTLPAPTKKNLASGDAAPIRAAFKNPPPDAAKLELRVIQP